ncbi:MAG TPA: hypothetical protein ENI16_00850 [Candidatus Portnoybacteria bacterium]|nr:hypothetical protein [Candidatus Portnoybacteria bacterium]
MNQFFNQEILKKIVACFLLVAIASTVGGGVLLYPKKTQAQFVVFDAATAIGDALKWAWEKVVEGVKSAYNKIASEVISWERAEKAFKSAVKVLWNIARKQMLNMLANDVIDWIQGGGVEKPRFVTDWKKFLREAANKAGGTFVDQYLGLGVLCEPFAVEIQIALGRTLKFDERARCTLEDIVENIEDFYDDFRVGGWTSWIKITRARNNIYGAYLLALNEKMGIEADTQRAALARATTGSGYLGQEACVKCRVKWRPAEGKTFSKNTSGKDECDEWKEAVVIFEQDPVSAAGMLATIFGVHEDEIFPDDTFTFSCTKTKVQTPGDLAAASMAKVANIDIDLLISAEEFEEYAGAIIDAVINRVSEEGLAYMKKIDPEKKYEKPEELAGFTRDAFTIEFQFIPELKILLKQQEELKKILEKRLALETAWSETLDSINKVEVGIKDILIFLVNNEYSPLPIGATAEPTNPQPYEFKGISFPANYTEGQCGYFDLNASGVLQPGTTKLRKTTNDTFVVSESITAHQMEDNPQTTEEMITRAVITQVEGAITQIESTIQTMKNYLAAVKDDPKADGSAQVEANRKAKLETLDTIYFPVRHFLEPKPKKFCETFDCTVYKFTGTDAEKEEKLFNEIDEVVFGDLTTDTQERALQVAERTQELEQQKADAYDINGDGVVSQEEYEQGEREEKEEGDTTREEEETWKEDLRILKEKLKEVRRAEDDLKEDYPDDGIKPFDEKYGSPPSFPESCQTGGE